MKGDFLPLDYIHSSQNQKVKFIKSLHRRKNRDKYNHYIIEGLKMVEEAILSEAPISNLMFSEDFDIESWQYYYSFYDSIPMARVSNSIFSSMSTLATPEGIMAVVEKTEKKFIFPPINSGETLLILDAISDPGNLGTIIRTMDAAASYGIILLEGSTDPYSPKALRSSMGSIFRLPILEVDNNLDFFDKIDKKANILAIASADGDNIYDWQDFDRHKNIYLVIGNESHGVSDDIKKISSKSLSLPIKGGAESLNASVAASILIYEIMRKRSLK